MTRRISQILIAIALVAGTAATASAGPAARVAPSFNESPGCGALDGYRGPFFRGGVSYDDNLLGPWGDFYGRTVRAARADLVSVQLPGMDSPKSVLVHRRALASMDQVLANLRALRAEGHTYTIRSRYTSSYNPRTIGGKGYLSFHGVGAAIDVNSHTNPFSGMDDNILTTNMPDWFVAAWTDAGWCWGGDWIDLKDPMHFSWKGPLHTPGYGPLPAPYEPLTDPAPYDRTIGFDTGLGTPAAPVVRTIDDIDRDGAPDVVEIRPYTPAGHLRVEAAVASTRFAGCRAAPVTTGPAAADRILMGDADRDGRTDMWALSLAGSTVELTVYPMTDDLSSALPPASTAVPADPAAHYLAGDIDRDGIDDLVTVVPGPGTRLEAWQGPAMTDLILQSEAALPTDAEWRFGLGDHDVDGSVDLFAVSGGDPAAIHVVHGLREPPVRVSTGSRVPSGDLGIGDLDGDGRDDVYVISLSGRLTVLPGNSPLDDDPAFWFAGPATNRASGAPCAPAGPGPERFRSLAIAALPDGTLVVGGPDPIDPAVGRVVFVSPDGSEAAVRLPGPAVDVAEAGGRAVVLFRQSGGTRLRVYDATGARLRTISLNGLTDPIGMAVLGTPDAGDRVAVLGTGGGRPIVRIRGVDGSPGPAIRPAGIRPAAITAVDESGAGSRLALVGSGAGDRPIVRLYDPAGGPVVGRRLAPALEAIDVATAETGTGPVIMVLATDPRTGAAHVPVLDRDLRRLTVHHFPPGREPAIGVGGDSLLLGFRLSRTGKVRLEARDVLQGNRVWRRTGAVGFDPAAITPVPGGVAMAAHRLGDGAVMLQVRDQATGRASIARVLSGPG